MTCVLKLKLILLKVNKTDNETGFKSKPKLSKLIGREYEGNQ